MKRITGLLAARLERIRRGEKADAGFTLIELLVVVIIIGILAAIAIPVFLNQRQSAWRSSIQADTHNATLATETFLTQNSGSLATLLPTTQTYCGTNTSPGCTETTGNDLVVKVSDGNKVTVSVTGSGSTAKYTVVTTNKNITSGSQTVYTYDSALGASSWSAS